MNFIDLGAWGAAEKHYTNEGVSFARYRNDKGEDWYQAVAHREDRPRGFTVALNEDMEIVMYGEDVSHIEPSLKRVVVLPDYVGTAEDKDALFGCRFDFATGTILPSARVPVAVTKAQGQIALFNADLLDDLEAAIAAHPYRPVRIWYESANVWERKNPYVNLLGPELNLTDEDIDRLFIEAAKL